MNVGTIKCWNCGSLFDEVDFVKVAGKFGGKIDGCPQCGVGNRKTTFFDMGFRRWDGQDWRSL
jgi:hypothetical protein